MRRLKRALALLLTLSVLVSVMTFPASAAEEFTVSVGSGEVNHGETIKLDVSIDNNTDLSALTVYVYYKADLLTCTDVDTKSDSKGSNTIWQDYKASADNASVLTNPDDTANISGDRSEAGWKMASLGYQTLDAGGMTTASGIIGSLTFTVADDVESCETPIEVEVVKATNSSNQDIPAAATNGTITIDGVIPQLDTVKLAQNTVNVVGGDATAQTVQATATSAKGTNITTGVTWSVTPADQGVTVDNSGVVSVTAKATADEYTITATPNSADSQGDAKTATLTVNRAAAAAASVSVVDDSSKDASAVTVQGANAPDGTTVKLTATVTDQYGESNAALAANAQWTVATEDGKEGDVTVSGGTVTVNAYAAAGTYTITATVGGQSDSYALTVERQTPEAKTVKVYDASGAEVTTATLAIPGTASKDYTFTAKVLDQFGAEMDASSVTWELTSAGAGITNAGGKVTVASTTADSATATLTAKAADDVTASVSLTARTIIMNWDLVFVVKEISYGMHNRSAVSYDAASYFATDPDGKPLEGKITVVDADEIQNAGERTITVTFTVTSEGEYQGTSVQKEYSVTVTPKELTVAPGDYAVSKSYDGTTAAGAASGALEVTGILSKDTGVSVQPGAIPAYSSANAGDYTLALPVSISGDTNGNYTLGDVSTVEVPAVITKAEVAITTDAPSQTIKANASENTDAAALKAFMALPETVTISGAGTVTSAPITWTDATEAYNVKGGTYTYVGTLNADANFANQPTLTATLTVSAVNATLSLGTTAVTKTMGEIKAAGNYSNFLPTAVTVTYDNAVAGTTYTITGWDKTLDELKAVDASAKDVALTLTPTFDAPAWATLGATPTFDLTITSKYPVKVSFTTEPTDITYGEKLTTPVAEQTAIDHDTDTGATFTYTYVGTKADGTTYNSTEAPKDAGTYTVTAELVSATHSGKATSGEFTISPLTAQLTWAGAEKRTYDGTASNVTATVTNLVGEDTCTVTVTGGKEANAGSHTATATALSNPNYVLPEAKTQAYTIDKANRNLSVTPADITLLPGSLTAQITASTDTDADKSAKITYAIGADDTAVKVDAAGKVTAVANGTATITVAIAATDNYNAVEKTVVVKALVQPLAGVSVTSSETGDMVAAAIENGKVVVSGIKTEGATLTVTPTAATVAGMNVSAASDGTNVTVKVDDTVVATYPIDTTAVVTKDAGITIEAEGKNTTNEVTGDKETAAGDAVSSSDTKVENLVISAAKALTNIAKQLETSNTDKIAESITGKHIIKVETTAQITAKALTDSSFKLAITPTYTVTATADTGSGGSGNDVVLASGVTLPNSAITTPVTISVKLPSGFPTRNLFARHYLTGGGTEILPVSVSGDVATWTQSSFSEVELFSDSRTGSITYTFADGSTQTVTYDAADVGNALPTDTKDGATFQGWTIGGTTYTTLTSELLSAISGKTLDAAASFKENTIPGGGGGGGSVISTFVITASAGQGGTISPTGRVSVNLNANKQFTIQPKDGYVIADVLVDGVSVGAVSSYTFERVNKNHTISVTFKVAEAVDVANIFRDISTSTWCYDAVQFVYVNGLMNGTTTSTFEPNRTLNRGMWVTMLYRMAGSPAISGTEDFTDVDASTWCYDALLWASRNGIVNGFDDGTFRANAVVTRQQLVAILYRYAQYMGYDTSASASLAGFVDAGSVWAVEPMEWALAEGVLAGTSATTLSPNGSANRGQAATFLMRFMNTLA